MKFAAHTVGSRSAAAALLLALVFHLPAAGAAGKGQRVVYEGLDLAIRNTRKSSTESKE